MSTAQVESNNNPDAAAGAVKRKAEDLPEATQPDLKKTVYEGPTTAGPTPTMADPATLAPMTATGQVPADGKAPSTKARAVRLEQNRKAARESRRRKKVMIEELQRSVIFFSRANTTLKQQNDELSRLLVQAQAQAKEASAKGGATKDDAAASTDATTTAVAEASPAKPSESETSQQEQQAKAQAVATQALFESQGFPAAAARAAAQTMNAGGNAANPTLSMQTGSTMQAMANFQQAAAAAMQSAIQGMSSIPGCNTALMTAAPPAGANAQQAYTDTMTALAMQQAAAAHHAQQFVNMGAASALMGGASMVNWAAAAAPQPATAETTQEKPADAKLAASVTKTQENV